MHHDLMMICFDTESTGTAEKWKYPLLRLAFLRGLCPKTLIQINSAYTY